MTKRLWRSAFRYINLHVLHADDTPHRVARGISIGVFVAVLPVFGIQMAIAFALAAWARGNRILAMAGTWLSNPFTSPVLFWFAWKLGHALLGMTGQVDGHAAGEKLNAIFQACSDATWAQLFNWSYWRESILVAGSLGFEIFVELWLGCLIVGVFTAIPAYYLTLYVVRKARAKRAHKKAERRRMNALKRATHAAAHSLHPKPVGKLPAQA